MITHRKYRSHAESTMGLLTDTKNCGLRMHRECWERFPRHRLQRKPLASDPGMHHGTCVTWCMSGSLTRGGGEMFPAYPAHVQPANLRIWQEAHSALRPLHPHLASTSLKPSTKKIALTFSLPRPFQHRTQPFRFFLRLNNYFKMFYAHLLPFSTEPGWRGSDTIAENWPLSEWRFRHIGRRCLVSTLSVTARYYLTPDDVIKWKHFPRNWPFVRGIHRSLVNSSHKGQWRGALMFSLIYVWINDWVNNREADDLRRCRAHYDAVVMNLETVTGQRHTWDNYSPYENNICMHMS